MEGLETGMQAALPHGQWGPEEGAEQRQRPARVLVADDDHAIASLMVRILSQQGWEVVRVADGCEAVESWPPGGEPFDVVILDVYMPRKNGYQAYRELRELHPDACFLFVSGWTEEDPYVSQIKAEGLPCLCKPFEPQALIGQVCALLSRRGFSLAARA